MRNFLIISFVVGFSLTGPSESFGQFNSGLFNRNQSIQYRGAQSAQSAIINRPTVSPYLALTDLTGVGGDLSSNYFTSVRPRIQQQQQQQQQQLQVQNLQRSITNMRSQAAQRSQQQGVRRTGHPTRFGMYLQYYPGLGGR